MPRGSRYGRCRCRDSPTSMAPMDAGRHTWHDRNAPTTSALCLIWVAENVKESSQCIQITFFYQCSVIFPYERSKIKLSFASQLPGSIFRVIVKHVLATNWVTPLSQLVSIAVLMQIIIYIGSIVKRSFIGIQTFAHYMRFVGWTMFDFTGSVCVHHLLHMSKLQMLGVSTSFRKFKVFRALSLKFLTTFSELFKDLFLVS